MYKFDLYRNKLPLLQFPIKLDVGAGAYPQPGFVRLDNDPCGGATDIVWNICNGIPLPDSSVSELYTSHFLEHLVPTDVHVVLQEMWRVCINGAKVTIKLPHGDTPEGRLPCHYSYWTEHNMRAIHQWFPHEGHPQYNGNYYDLQKVYRVEYHLIGEFLIVKGKPL